ncbi:phytanoyl-CoA dioxygenase [Lotmaria passim]
MSAHLTNNDILDYLENGVLLIHHALTPEQVETLKRGIVRAYKGSSIDPDCPTNDTDDAKQNTKVFEAFPCYRDHPAYKEIIFHSDLPRFAAQLTGSRTIRLHHEQIHVEVPKVEERTPWHTDELLFNVGGNQNLSMFVTVDPIPEGSVEFVLGSHKWPSTMPRYLREMFAKDLSTDVVPEPPNVEAARKTLPIVSWNLEPGDCVAFSLRTLHFLKSATALRRGMSVRYIGDDATYAPRAWISFPAFPELEKDAEGMTAGSPMRHSLFPIVYTAETKL